MKTKNDGMTVLERFEAENERIFRESQQADKEARAKISEYEKKLVPVKGKREKAAAKFEEMRTEYERIEAEALEAERRRIGSAVNTKEDAVSGKISMEEYFRTGQTQESIDDAARTETTKKLGYLLEAVRVKGLEVLKLEVEEAECEREILFLNSYPATFMLERMRAQVKSLESVLIASTSGGMHVWTDLDTKRAALARANGKAAGGMVWHDLDLAAVKRMRFYAGLPDSEIPVLHGIIAEMESRPDSKVSLRFVSISVDGKNGLDVLIWR